MHPDNGFYGHRGILAAAAGRAAEDAAEVGFLAHVQHGWAPFGPVGHPEREPSQGGFLAWSDHDARTVAALGVRRVTPIGAPFLYLRRSLGLEEPESAERPGDGSLIVYPGHGWEREEMSGNHARLIADIEDRSTGPVTVCLYWVEYDQQPIRRAYEEAGFRVVTHGHRSDPDFLHRQVDELLRHDVVATNHLSTAIWYGGALGRAITRFGPEFTIYDEAYRAAWADYQHRRWPEIDDRVLSGSAAREAAEIELGAGSRRSPEELAELLSLVPRRAGPPSVRLRRASYRAEHAARRVVAATRARVAPGRIQARDLAVMRSAAES